MIKGINKKAVFYSLSVVLFLVFLLIVFNTKAEIQKRDDRFHLGRAQIVVMDHFVRDFDRYYLNAILETSAKPALINLTKIGVGVFNKDRVVSTMNGSTGSLDNLLTTGENYQQALNTLSFPINDKDFSFILQSVNQLNYYRIRLNFLVNYRFKVSDTEWSKDDKLVSVDIDVYGLGHPVHGGIIDSSWVQNTEVDAGCYVDQIFTDVTGCTGNIRPYLVCGDGIVDGSECEPPGVPNVCDDSCHTIIIT